MNRGTFLNNELEQQFKTDGIVQIPLLNKSEIELLLAYYNATSGQISDQKFHSTMFINDPAYRKSADHKIRGILLPKVNQLIENYRMLFANFIVKQSHADTMVGIHQDWNFTSPDYVSVNVWVPLVDINEQTGLFYALKGSHQTFRNIRYTPYEDNAYSKLEEYICENSSPFEIKAGHALFYHGGLVHYSNPNTSGSIRVAVGGAMIPAEAPNLHYYKRDKQSKRLEVYAVDETFYQGFDFFNEPCGVKLLEEIEQYETLPELEALTSYIQ